MLNPIFTPIVSLIAGIIIFIFPQTLNLVVALYLIIVGVLGLLGKKTV